MLSPSNLDSLLEKILVIPTSSTSTTPELTSSKEQVFLPDTIIDPFVTCPEAFYSNINVLLEIFATLPVIATTTELIFSFFMLLKTCFRSTMSEARLNCLTMMYIYRDIDAIIDTVIDKFAKFNR